MSLQRQTLIAITIITVASIAALFVFSNIILDQTFTALEQTEVEKNVARVSDALDNELFVMDKFALDYAGWDDTYNFVLNGNTPYIENNLLDETFIKQDLNMMLVVNNQRQLVYGKAYDLKKQVEIPVPSSVKELLTPGSPLLRHSSITSKTTGLVLFPEGPALIASRPILTSQYKGPIRGAFITVRYLDSDLVSRLKEITHLQISIQDLNQTGLPADLFRHPYSTGKNTLVKPINSNLAGGYRLLADIYGNPKLAISILSERSTYQRSAGLLNRFLIVLMFVGLLTGILNNQLIRKLILYRLNSLAGAINRIREDKDFALRVPVSGNDEMTRLSEHINQMLDSLESYHESLSKSEARYRAIVEDQTEMICRFKPGGVITFVNDALAKYYGLQPRDLIDTSLYELFPEEERYIFASQISSLSPTNLFIESIHRIVGSDGSVRWLEWSKRMLFDADNNFLEYQVVGRDVTDRSHAEEKLKYLSIHDTLTGLYNRTYFEAEMQRLDNQRSLPVGIIIGDLDGLKLINDTLGHQTGDELLKVAADTISKYFRSSDVVARVGGDEFAIILPNCSIETVAQACNRIKSGVSDYNEKGFTPLSLSLGFAVREDMSVSLSDLYKEADNNMYREKLHSSRSARAAIVTTLKKALEARDFFTDGHADRLQHLAAKLGEALGVSGQDLNDLKLLAQFHDIGKVGIPDRILFKPGPLTTDEK
ncbi:MAG: CHASE4 domain-containing protein, partial [Candidatus Saccharibacteria bacterium]